MRRIIVAALVGVLAVALSAPGAWAAPPREDVVGDVAVPKGDIVTGTYSANFTDIFLTGFKARVTLREGSNPVTTPAWLLPQTDLVVQLDTTNTHVGPDLAVIADAVDEGGVVLVADVYDTTTAPISPVPCAATATFTAPNIYKVRLPADCFSGTETSVRARFRMRWDRPPAGGPVSLDKSPDAGWGSNLAAPPPPP